MGTQKDMTNTGGGGVCWKRAKETVVETMKEGRHVIDESGEVNKTKTF